MAQRRRIRVKCKNSACCPFHRQQTRGEVAGRAVLLYGDGYHSAGRKSKKAPRVRAPNAQATAGSDDSGQPN